MQDFALGALAVLLLYQPAIYSIQNRHRKEVRFLRSQVDALKERHREAADGLLQVAMTHPVYGPRLRAIDGGRK